MSSDAEPATAGDDLYRVLRAADGGMVLARSGGRADSGEPLYEFWASSDREAVRIYAAFESGFEVRLDADPDREDGAGALSRRDVTPFWIFAGVMWLSLAVIVVTLAAVCVHNLIVGW